MSVRLHVEFNDDLTHDHTYRGDSPAMSIYWSNGEAAYPQRHWQDAGATLLACWLTAAQRLAHGAMHEDFVFMNGGYHLTVRPSGTSYRLSSPDLSGGWSISREGLYQELLTHAEQVCAKLSHLGSQNPTVLADCHALRAGMDKLNAFLEEEKLAVLV